MRLQKLVHIFICPVFFLPDFIRHVGYLLGKLLYDQSFDLNQIFIIQVPGE